MSLWLEDWAVWGFQLTWCFNGLAGLGISADWVNLGVSIKVQMDWVYFFCISMDFVVWGVSVDWMAWGNIQWTGCF